MAQAALKRRRRSQHKTRQTRQTKGKPSQALEHAFVAHHERALSLLKARCFDEASRQFECALDVICEAQKTSSDLKFNLALLTRVLQQYTGLLIRQGVFTLAERYITEANACFCRLKTKALLKGSRDSYHYFQLGRAMGEVQHAYMALRQHAYPQALAVASSILTGKCQLDDSRHRKHIQASAHMVKAWVYYEQKQIQQARRQVELAQTLVPDFEDARTLDVLTQARLLQVVGKETDAFSTCLAGCCELLCSVGIAVVQSDSELLQVQAILNAVSQVQENPQTSPQLLPDEQEEIGAFLILLGSIMQEQGQTDVALHLLLQAGALLPQADTVAIAEFDTAVRAFGDRALREPIAFATLDALLFHPFVLQRWEFVEAVLEALGRIPLAPALASVVALKPQLPQHLPQDTRQLQEAIQADLAQQTRIDGDLARLLGLHVVSNTCVQFYIKGPFQPETVDLFLKQIEAIVHHWQLQDVGMADPEPATPETEQLTDLLEEAVLKRFKTVKVGLQMAEGNECLTPRGHSQEQSHLI